MSFLDSCEMGGVWRIRNMYLTVLWRLKKIKDEQQQYNVIATWTGCTCLNINHLVSLTGSHLIETERMEA